MRVLSFVAVLPIRSRAARVIHSITVIASAAKTLAAPVRDTCGAKSPTMVSPHHRIDNVDVIAARDTVTLGAKLISAKAGDRGTRADSGGSSTHAPWPFPMYIY
jgi:hypothetical protein